MWHPLRRAPRALAAEADVFLQAGDPGGHQPFEVALELLSHKRVKQRTNATVQVGYVPGHVQSIVQTLRGRTRGAGPAGARYLNSSKEDDNVVGGPADEEGEDDDKYELDGPALLLHAGGEDADGDANVAVHHHEQRQEEEEQELLVVTDQTPLLHDVLCVS